MSAPQLDLRLRTDTSIWVRFPMRLSASCGAGSNAGTADEVTVRDWRTILPPGQILTQTIIH